jgi:hypothetical protein
LKRLLKIKDIAQKTMPNSHSTTNLYAKAEIQILVGKWNYIGSNPSEKNGQFNLDSILDSEELLMLMENGCILMTLIYGGEVLIGIIQL